MRVVALDGFVEFLRKHLRCVLQRCVRHPPFIAISAIGYGHELKVYNIWQVKRKVCLIDYFLWFVLFLVGRQK